MEVFMGGIRILLAASITTCALWAQEDSRFEAIAGDQDKKAASAQPDELNRVERALNEFRQSDTMARFTEGYRGFRVKLGGLAPGAGFAAGPGYGASMWDGRFIINMGAQASFRGYQKFVFDAEVPSLANGRIFAGFHAVRHNYPGMNYYGSGPRSRKTGRTDYRLEDVALDGRAGVRLARGLTAGVSAGYLFNNIGPGSDSRYASAETVYAAYQAPGIDAQSNFLRTGAFAQYEWRDNPDGPRRGGSYFAQFSDFRDRTLGAYNFRRLDMEAQQYVSVLNHRRVFAVRAKSALTFRQGGLSVPFYMQPAIGGSEDLRGYRPFRFRDNNMVVFNGEYRWEVFSGLDMALFADAGQVFTHKSDFDLSRLESDAGFGFRFNARNRTFMRVDVAFSHEGYQVWVKFGGLFRKGPTHSSSSMGDF
jgi:outer membrane protein assembly factor BamA